MSAERDDALASPEFFQPVLGKESNKACQFTLGNMQPWAH